MSITIPGLNGKQFKIKLSKLFFPLLIFAVVVIVFIKFSEIREIGRLFQKANWFWLFLAFASQLLNFSLQGSVYQSIFKLLGIPCFSFLKIIKTSITVIFLNYAIPTFGLAGNLWLFRILKKNEVKTGSALMSLILEFVCYYIAFALLLIFSFFYLFFKLGHIGIAQKLAVVGFVVLLIFISSVVYFFLGSKKRAKKRVIWLAKKIDLAEDGLAEPERVHALLNDFYDDFDWIKNNKKLLIKPVSLQFVKFLVDGLNIYLIFLAFGVAPVFGLGLVAFALGRLFGLLSFIPGGLGAFEGSMVLVFNSLGISLELSLAVMLLYRFFSFWLYFPFGIIFYRHMNGEKSVG